MLCDKCHNKIGLIYFLIETVNIFKIGKHICPYCKYEYKIKVKLFLFYCYSVGIGRCLKYIFIMYKGFYNTNEIIVVWIIRMIFIYMCCVVQQLIYWKR